MSRQIDPERIASGNLTEDERRYLEDRAIIPREGAITPNPEENVNTDDPTGQLSEWPSDSESTLTPPSFGTPDEGDDEGSEDEDEYEDYEEGWTNTSRRAALTERGLSVEGKKEELIARLIRSDNDELTDEDQVDSEE